MVDFNHYNGKYTSEHSIYIQEEFDIGKRGVDIYTKNNVAIEVKETFAKEKKNQWFKVKKHQLEESDFILFCVNNEKFYILDCEDLLGMYEFDNFYNRCCIRLGTIKKHKIFKAKSYDELKDFLESL